MSTLDDFFGPDDKCPRCGKPVPAAGLCADCFIEARKEQDAQPKKADDTELWAARDEWEESSK